jgi:hypothetical protein
MANHVCIPQISYLSTCNSNTVLALGTKNMTTPEQVTFIHVAMPTLTPTITELVWHIIRNQANH